MMNPAFETIKDGEDIIALILRTNYNEPGIHFLTPSDFTQQVAFMSHPRGKKLAPHIHNQVPRNILNTQEALFIRKGRVKVTLFNSQRRRLGAVELTDGDLILLCSGGHSFEMLEDTTMIEVKQGPYAGEDDKTRFEEIE